MKILETYWFNGGGIVRVLDDYEGIKYYIRGTAGDDQDTRIAASEKDDAQYIADWGSTFPKAAGDALFGMTELPEDLPAFLRPQAD